MKTLMIVARDSMAAELERLLEDNDINAYSIINKVGGKGKTGKVGPFSDLSCPGCSVVATTDTWRSGLLRNLRGSHALPLVLMEEACSTGDSLAANF